MEELSPPAARHPTTSTVVSIKWTGYTTASTLPKLWTSSMSRTPACGYVKCPPKIMNKNTDFFVFLFTACKVCRLQSHHPDFRPVQAAQERAIKVQDSGQAWRQNIPFNLWNAGPFKLKPVSFMTSNMLITLKIKWILATIKYLDASIKKGTS